MSEKLTDEEKKIRDKLRKLVELHQNTPKDQRTELPERFDGPIGFDDDGNPLPVPSEDAPKAPRPSKDSDDHTKID